MRIDVFFDTVCPWCWIGKRHLEMAIEQWDGESVSLHYHPYLLDPSIPEGGYNFKEHMMKKGGGRVPLEQWFDAPRRAGEAVGIDLQFDKIEKTPNTLLSHQMIACAPEAEKGKLIEAIFEAHFRDSRDIGDRECLLAIAQEQGIDSAFFTEAKLAEAKESVMAELQMGQEIGISGVPFYVIDNTYSFSGAQPPEAIVNILTQAASMKSKS
ncbi:DsbA family protein [Anaerolineales bacterium]